MGSGIATPEAANFAALSSYTLSLL